MREIVNALLYQSRTGCQWELLPHDLPPTDAVRCYFDVWKRDGLDARINEMPRMMVRERAGRSADPSLVVLDSQTVRAAAGVPKSTAGLDVRGKTPGPRRGLAADVIGLIIAVVVVAAPVHDNAIGTALPNKVAPAGSVRTAPVDQGFKPVWSSTARDSASTFRSSSATRPAPGSSPGPSGGASKEPPAG